MLPTPGLGKRDNVICSSLAQKRWQDTRQQARREASWGKLMGETSVKSPSWELVGGAQALLFTEPAALFPSPQGEGREEAPLATQPPPRILFFKDLGLGWCSGVCQWRSFGHSSVPMGWTQQGGVPHVSANAPLTCPPLLTSLCLVLVFFLHRRGFF